MAIPKDIRREDVLKAFEFINEKGEEPRRKSRVFKVVYESALFSPKYVISLANRFSINRSFLTHDKFYTYEAMYYLKALGFKNIITISGNFEFLEDPLSDNHLSDLEKCKGAILKLRKIKSRQKRRRSIEVADREGAEFIRLLKKMAKFKCQFPGCESSIKTKKGFYVEVAHIEPWAKGGRTFPDNLLVLCPNHHKEFDLGELLILNQSKMEVEFQLNQINYVIPFIINDI